MVKKISFSQIVRDHIGTLVHYETLKRSYADIFLFFSIPAFFSFILWDRLTLDKDSINVLITAASIFAGLLLNLLVLIYTLIGKAKECTSTNRAKTKKLLLEQTFANVSFCILVSVCLVITCLLKLLNSPVLNDILNIVIYFLTPLLVLTLLMVLKRIHALISSEFF